jgi:hypothetical protein
MIPLKLMKRIVLILCLGMMMSYAHTQQYVEVGVFGGLSNYQGDLAPVAFVPKGNPRSIWSVLQVQS